MWTRARRKTDYGIDCLFVLILLLGTFEIYAEPPANIPTPAEPHRQTLPSEPVAPKPAPEIETRPGTQLMPQGAKEIKIDPFNGVRLVGGTVYPDNELETFYKDLIGRNINLEDVYEIAQNIQKKYRDDGYRLTRVVLPEQTVTDNVFELRIIEGYIRDVRIEGDTGGIEDHIDSLLRKVTIHKPVNWRELERYLLLVNDMPGIQARGVLRPTKEGLGASELVLRVDRSWFEGFATINNRGSRYTGPWRGMLVNRTHSALGLGERLELLLLAAPEEEQKYASLSYQQPIGSEGLLFNLVMSYGPSEPGHTLEVLEMESKVAHFGTSMTYPWLRSRNRNLFTKLGFDAVNSDVDMLDAPVSRDRLRVLHVGGSYDTIGQPGAQSKFGLFLRQGLTILGANSNGDEQRSRTEGRNDFTSIQFMGSRHQQLVGGTVFQLNVKGQYAFDTLLSDEEFRLGGEQLGRGYDPSELAGEHGLALSAELQHNVRTTYESISEYQLYGFYDVGVVWNEDTGSEPRETLASAGLGVRARAYDNFTIGLELAKPLTREVSAEGDKDPRIYLQLSAHY